jgi:DNA-binding NarL/FixJ family response regulator
MPIRVVAAEDSFLAREGIVSILGDIDDVELVEMSADLDELRAAVERTSPDIVLTDIRMPPTNTDEGIRFAAELRDLHPEMGVVVLSQHAEPRYAMALFNAGSDRRAYLLKERLHDKSELSRAIHDVADGRSLVDSRVVDKLVSAHQRSESELGKLTPRELEILGLIAEGRSNGSIASGLGVTKRAIERHINAIFVKLDLGKPEDVSRRVKAALLYLGGDAV